MSKRIKLEADESIIAAVPKICNGPGWTNTPIIVYILNTVTCKCRDVYIQPQDQTAAMQLLFCGCQAAHNAMLNAVVTTTKRMKR